MKAEYVGPYGLPGATISNMSQSANFRMNDESFRRMFRRKLLSWFEENKRALPWRANRDPYHVWVSEIMLQQTRVAVVIGYYERFMKRFPDVGTLARARETSVVAAWSGLGYYRRARALHAAAKMIVRELGGLFPQSAKDLQELPGIGRYTAAAIASLAFGERCAVVDGNVERVLERVLGWGHTDAGFWEIAQELLSPERPGDFNEAMMELGATVCLPGKPLCTACPVARLCVTRGPGQAGESAVRKKRELRYALAITRQSVYMVMRSATASLMAGMWELPAAREDGSVHDVVFRLRHSITDTDYSVVVVREAEGSEGEWVPFRRAGRLGLTGLTRKILRKAGVIE
jgi:A/G-specific adenine glycosylase